MLTDTGVQGIWSINCTSKKK